MPHSTLTQPSRNPHPTLTQPSPNPHPTTTLPFPSPPLLPRPDRGSKNLNTINIQSIAASLRQHGLGILNTTVNYTYVAPKTNNLRL